MHVATLHRLLQLIAIAAICPGIAVGQQYAVGQGYAVGQEYHVHGTPFAQPVSTTNATIADLTRRLKALEEQVKKDNIDNGWQDVSSQGWTHKPNGRVLTETVMWMDDANGQAQNYTEIRQVRLAMRGTGYGVYDYRVQVDFEPETNAGGTVVGSVGMKDVYAGIHEVPILGYVRIGHYKVPFSHDQMLARRDMTFMERYPMADPNGFTPGREIGIAAFNHSADQNVAWGYGAFFDSISETTMQRLDDNQGFLTGGRITWTPYYDEPSGGRYLVHLGLGALYTKTQDFSGRFSQRPEIHEGPILIDTGAIAAGEYGVVGTEVLVHWGPVYINHELMWAVVNDAGVGRTDLYSGYVEAGWFLTGEHRRYDRKVGTFMDLTPFTNFWLVPGCRGAGAWEIAARWSFVDFSNAPNASKYNSAAVALNWYWNPRTRFQLNWIQPFTSGAPLGTTYSSILAGRLALYF